MTLTTLIILCSIVSLFCSALLVVINTGLDINDIHFSWTESDSESLKETLIYSYTSSENNG